MAVKDDDHIHKDDDERGIPSALPSRGPGKMLKDVLRSLLPIGKPCEVYLNSDKVVKLLLHIKSDDSLLRRNPYDSSFCAPAK